MIPRPLQADSRRSILQLVGLLASLLLVVNIESLTRWCGWPTLSVAVAFVCLLVLPGLVLSNLFVREHCSFSKRLSLSLVASFGLCAIPAVLLLRLGGNLRAFKIVYKVTVVFVYLLYIARMARREGWSPARRGDALPVGEGRRVDWASLLLWVGAAACLLLVLSFFVSVARVYHASDRVLEAATIRHFLDADRFFEQSYLVSSTTPVSAREYTAVWELLIALIVDVTRLPLEDVYSFYLPPLLIAYAYLVTFQLGRTVVGSVRAGLVLCILQTLFFFTDLVSLPEHVLSGNSSYGFYMVTKIAEDKALLRFIFVPILQMIYLDYLRCEGKGRENKWFYVLLLGLIAITYIHPLGLVYVTLSFVAYAGLGLFLDRTKVTLAKIIPVLVVILVLFMPLVVAKIELAQTEDMEYIEDPFAKAWGLKTLGQTRLYVVDPYLLTYHRLTLLCLALVPLLVPAALSRSGARSSAGARFLLANVGIVALTAFNPIAAPLVAKVVNPMLLWRLTWLLPGTLIPVYLSVHGVRWARRRWRPRVKMASRALLVVAVLAASGSMAGRFKQGIQRLIWFRDHGTSNEQREALLFLREVGRLDSVILADFYTTRNIPSFVGFSYGLTFRNRPPRVPSAPEDLQRFYEVDRLDALHLATIDRHSVNYVIVPSTSQMSRQLAAVESAFLPVYENGAFAIFEVQPGWRQDERVSLMIAADALYDKGRFLDAEAGYQALLRLVPGNFWALYRLGSIYEKDGSLERAAELYQTSIAAEATWEAYARLGRVYRGLRRPQEAIEAFEQARELGADPREMSILQGMAEGDYYQFDGDLEQAVRAYRSALALKAQKPEARAATEHPYMPSRWPRVDLEWLQRLLGTADKAKDVPAPVSFDGAEARPAVEHDLLRGSEPVRSLTVREGRIQPSIFIVDGDAREVIFQHPPSSFAVRVSVPASAELRFGIALSPEVWKVGKGDGVQFDLYVEEGETRWHPFSSYIDPKNVPADRRWHDHRVDLGLWAGREVSLTFVTSPGPNGDARFDWSGWSNPVLLSFD